MDRISRWSRTGRPDTGNKSKVSSDGINSYFARETGPWLTFKTHNPMMRSGSSPRKNKLKVHWWSKSETSHLCQPSTEVKSAQRRTWAVFKQPPVEIHTTHSANSQRGNICSLTLQKLFFTCSVKGNVAARDVPQFVGNPLSF